MPTARIAGGHYWLIVAEDPENILAPARTHILYQLNLYSEWLEKAGQQLFPYMPDVEAVKGRRAGLRRLRRDRPSRGTRLEHQ